MLLGRAKSCLWQVFVRRRPPKQGELRTDVSKATMFQGDRAAKGFNFVRAKPPLRRAESRFGKPRTSRKGTVLFFSLVRKERGVPQRFANLWTPGTIQSSIEEGFSRVFRRHVSKPAFRTKRWRKGFESVRKGYRTADARLRSFEKGLLYCKLTVGFRG